MIFGIGHYNDEKQADFVRYMTAAFQRHHDALLESPMSALPHLPNQFSENVIVPGIQTRVEADHITRRHGLLLKIVHPGVAPTKDERALIDYPWDYILGVNGDSESLIADAQEFADWWCGHARRPDQSAIARQATLQIEQDAINDNVS